MISFGAACQSGIDYVHTCACVYVCACRNQGSTWVSSLIIYPSFKAASCTKPVLIDSVKLAWPESPRYLSVSILHQGLYWLLHGCLWSELSPLCLRNWHFPSGAISSGPGINLFNILCFPCRQLLYMQKNANLEEDGVKSE